MTTQEQLIPDGSAVSVCVLGPDGSGKSAVAAGIRERLDGVVGSMDVRHLKPRLFFRRRTRRSGPVTDPHGLPGRSAPTSVLKLLLWTVELWIDWIFRVRDRPQLTVWDRYFHDLLVDPARYRYGGPMWAPRLLTHFVPEPDLFIILDAPAQILQARKQEVTMEESARQRTAYRDLVTTLKSSVIVNAASDLDIVILDATNLTIAYLNRKRLAQDERSKK